MKKLLSILAVSLFTVSLALTISVIINNPDENTVKASIDPDTTYKRPSIEGSQGTRCCGDTQETACTFGSKC
jgi:hypothetical protein